MSNHPAPGSIAGLTQNWTFFPSPVALWQRCQLIEMFARYAERKPRWHSVKPLSPRDNWAVYFIFSPDGLLSSAHEFTLSRLRDLGMPLLVVCACRAPEKLPPTLAGYCDALFWKDLPGYDFSAYSLALHQIARISPGADVLLMNDSVFGPFSDLRGVLAEARWDLTGFTASSHVTNHIQSYAFLLKAVNRMRMAKLATVFFPFVALSKNDAVIPLQETRLARVAARSMDVGAFWFGDANEVIDPSLVRPIELLNAGFPFLKRSLVGKHASFINRELVLQELERLGHPLV